MSSLDHMSLYIFLFSGFVIWGIFFASIKDKYYFWMAAVLPILTYAMIVGSRYGWGPDYLSYKLRFEQSFIVPEAQIGFRYLNQAMFGLGFNYVGCFVLYSVIFMTCAFRLMKDYGQQSKYMYAFVVPATLHLIGNGIRQGVALSFILLAISCINRKKYLQVVFWSLVGATIHSSVIVTIAFIILIWLFRTRPLNWRLTIPLYLFFAYIYDVSKTGFIAQYIQKLSLDGPFQGYTENADYWFGQAAANDIYRQSPFAQFMFSLFCVSFIYLGHRVLRNVKTNNVTYLYNTVVIGMILYRTVFLFEILRRFAEPLVMLYFVVLGYIIYAFLGGADIEGNNTLAHKWKFKLGLLFMLLYIFLYWGRFTFFNPSALFFWNLT